MPSASRLAVVSKPPANRIRPMLVSSWSVSSPALIRAAMEVVARCAVGESDAKLLHLGSYGATR